MVIGMKGYEYLCVHSINTNRTFDSETALSSLQSSKAINYSLIVEDVPMSLFSFNSVGFLHDATNSQPKLIYNRDAGTSELANGEHVAAMSIFKSDEPLIKFNDLAALKVWMLENKNVNVPLINNDILADDLNISTLIGIIYCADKFKLDLVCNPNSEIEEEIAIKIKEAKKQPLQAAQQLRAAIKEKFGKDVTIYEYDVNTGILTLHTMESSLQSQAKILLKLNVDIHKVNKTPMFKFDVVNNVFVEVEQNDNEVLNYSCEPQENMSPRANI